MKRFSIHIPGFVYAMTCYGTGKSDAIKRFKAQQNFARMPKGYSIWEA